VPHSFQRLDDHPELEQIVRLVAAQNPLQAKRIQNFLSQQTDAQYWAFAESLSGHLNRTFLKGDTARLAAAQAYNHMCLEILREQIRFRKSGIYLHDDSSQADAAVYSQPDVMRPYILGLLLSYLFWPNHYRLFAFFQDHLADGPVEQALDVGAGHGLFTAETLRHYPHSTVTVVDLSATSLELAREVFAAFEVGPAQVRLRHDDFLAAALPEAAFDLLIMGEVLEHVSDVAAFMRRARALLKPDGRVFLTTCANCPAVDHIRHFHTVGEIQDVIRAADFKVVHEVILPAEAVPEERWQTELVTINYGAILQRISCASQT